MKRKIKLLCCIVFCICIFSENITFADTKAYNLDAIEEVFELYDYNESFLDILKKEESFSYRSIAAYYEKHKFMNWATNLSAVILGENLSEDEYVEMLSEITVMNQYTITEQIAEYGNYNTTRDFKDFLNDAVDVGFDIVDFGEFFNFDNKTSKIIYNTFKIGNTVENRVEEYAEITEDGAKYYQALLESYASSLEFLTAVSNNSKVENLRNAAKKLIAVNDSVFRRAYYLVEKISTEVIVFSMETFVDDIMTPASEFVMEYASGEEKTILKRIAIIGENLSTFKATFNFMMFIGNYSFGTSDTFAYLQRIKAIDEIASCVICEMDKISIDSYEDRVEQYKAIMNKCLWYRWLVTINGRGESYACTMLTNSNNGLADIDDLIKMFKGELTVKEKYDLQLESLVRFNKNYLQPIFDIDVFASPKDDEAKNSSETVAEEDNIAESIDVTDQYLEFVKQYEGEVFYSIENIKEGQQPVLLIAFSTENKWDYEFCDDESIYSSTCEIYDYINGEIVHLGSLISFLSRLALYTKEDNFYVAARSNAHSYCFNCVRNNAMYSYGYNTNNIVEDTVQYGENSEYYNYAYGTRNYDNAVSQYSEVKPIVFKKYVEEEQTTENEYTGLVNVGENQWYYQENGETQWDYTGLVKYYETWYYIENGVLNWNYTGLTKYYETWYYVENSVLNWNYTGLTKYYETWYYVENGVLNWNYTGFTDYYGTKYYVEKGVLNWDYTTFDMYRVSMASDQFAISPVVAAMTLDKSGYKTFSSINAWEWDGVTTTWVFEKENEGSPEKIEVDLTTGIGKLYYMDDYYGSVNLLTKEVVDGSTIEHFWDNYVENDSQGAIGYTWESCGSINVRIGGVESLGKYDVRRIFECQNDVIIQHVGTNERNRPIFTVTDEFENPLGYVVADAVYNYFDVYDMHCVHVGQGCVLP